MRSTAMRSFQLVVSCVAFLGSVSFAETPATSWNAVDQALGRGGATQPDGVRRYGFPRSDLHVVLDGIAIKPALALGGWAAFQPGDAGTATVMGDLVLTPPEVNPVMRALLRNGFHVTAVHNHLLRLSTPIVYMHVESHGDAVRLATGLHAALALSHTPGAAPAAPAAAALDLQTAAIDRIMGRNGKANGGVYQFTFPRAERIMHDGMAEPASMGTGTGINFQPTGGGRAAVTGDFVLLGSEVDPVMHELSDHGIDVTALHSHMIGEQPTIYFMHFWGVGPAAQLATTLRAAIDRTNVQR